MRFGDPHLRSILDMDSTSFCQILEVLNVSAGTNLQGGLVLQYGVTWDLRRTLVRSPLSEGSVYPDRICISARTYLDYVPTVSLLE